MNRRPLALGRKDRLVMNDRLERNKAWALSRFVGVNLCRCPEFSNDEIFDDRWCFGNRDGTMETEQKWGEKIEEDEDEFDRMVHPTVRY